MKYLNSKMLVAGVLCAATMAGMASATCTPVTASALIASDAAYLDMAASHFTSLNTLVLVVRAKQVADRAIGTVDFNGATNVTACNYPAQAAWVHSLDDASCEEMWTGTLSWPVVREQCGLERTNPSTDVERFTGVLTVTQIDEFGEVRNTTVTRTTVSELEFQLTFDLTVNITSSGAPRVYAPIAVESYVVNSQVYAQSNLVTATVFNSVQYPFVLVAPVLGDASTPANVVISGLTTSSNGCGLDEPCERSFTLNLVPGACTITGAVFTVIMQIQCNAALATSDCPLRGNETASIAFTLTTPDMCAIINETESLSGSLATYSSPTYATARTAFFIDQTVYVETLVSSPKVVLVNNTYRSVQLTIGAAGKRADEVHQLVADDDGTAFGDNLAYARTQYANGNGRFHFKLDSQYITVPADQFRTFTLDAEIVVQYTNAKRSTLRFRNALNSDSIAVSGAFDVAKLVEMPVSQQSSSKASSKASSSMASSEDNSAASVAASILVATAATLAAMLF